MAAGGNAPPLFVSTETIFKNLSSSTIKDCSDQQMAMQLGLPVWGAVADVPEKVVSLEENKSASISSVCGLAGVLYYMLEYLSPAHQLMAQVNQVSIHMLENDAGIADRISLHANCEEVARLFPCDAIAKEIAFIKNAILGGDLLMDWKRLEYPEAMTENGVINTENFRQKTIHSPHAFIIKELLLVMQDYYQIPVLVIPISDKEIGIAMNKDDLIRIRELEQVGEKSKPTVQQLR